MESTQLPKESIIKEKMAKICLKHTKIYALPPPCTKLPIKGTYNPSEKLYDLLQLEN